MDIPSHLILLLLLACLASGQFKHSKRRPLFSNKSRFNLTPPKNLPLVSAPTFPPTFPPTPPPQASSVEVQRAEVHSGEFLPSQEQQNPFPGNVHFQGFGAGADFQNPPQQRPRFQEQPQQRSSFQEPSQQRASFRSFGSSTPRPKEHATPIPIIRLEKQQSLDGSYKSNYETGNSIHAEETGFVKNAGKGEDKEALVQYGSYSYTDPDGQLVQVSYQADEGGFRATGSHLPTPPPVPPEVQRGLDIIFEGIRRDAEREAKRKKLKRVIEPDNYPVGFIRNEENSQTRPPISQSKQ